jgi:predicted dehydrogenase
MAIKTAVIGLGIMGRRMLEHMGYHENYTPDILWDPDPDACALALFGTPGATVAENAEAAIANADLVYLACPPIPRKEYALAAATAGKAVFLEKPLGIDINESADLVDQLNQLGVPAAVNFTQAAGVALTEVSSSTQTGHLGDVVGIDIVVTYAHWPREWQKAADWLRFRAEGGMTREVVSHFLFFSERILGPLHLVWSRPSYPQDKALCETHMLARLETTDGRPVTVMASVGGAQPDRQELTVKGTKISHRISEFYRASSSKGGKFLPVGSESADPGAVALKAQLDDFLLCMDGKPNRLSTPKEALRVQGLVEHMLLGKN